MSTQTSMRHSAVPALIAMVALLPSCATARSQPDWIENPAELYPSSRFMVGVGEGEDVEAAKAKALGDISSIFESEVRQVIKSHQTLIERNGIASDASLTDVDTRLITTGNFEGIEIREKWCCSSGMHYVLVVLDRSKAERSLADRMDNFETEIRHKLAGLGSAETPLEQARIVMATLEPARGRDELLAQYRVVSGGPWKEKPTTSALEQRRIQAVDDATFVIEANTYQAAKNSTQGNRELAKAMEEVVSDSQFKLDRSGRGTMKLACTVNLGEPFQRSERTGVEYTWDASCEIGANQPGARAILVAEESRTVSANSESIAKKKALMKSQKAMLHRMKSELRNYLAEGAQSTQGAADAAGS